MASEGGGQPQRRAELDFEVAFTNGGGMQGQGFRLDIPGGDVDEATLADLLVRDLRLLMVGEVRLRNVHLLAEQHRRGDAGTGQGSAPAPRRLVDLSHSIEDGLITYKGLPAPTICDYLSREQSRATYAEGTEFQIARIEMVANTGTYLDSPFHRFAAGRDLSELDLDGLADLEGVVARVTGMRGRAVRRDALVALDVRDRAVLIHTGWAAHWRTDRYFEDHPFLTADAAEYLRDAGARLVAIDSLNIDDIADGRRPVHTTLLRAEIPIVEHLCGLEQLPASGFRFSAVPVKVKGMGTFPVRAYASLDR
jgi:kynurenine formamidase